MKPDISKIISKIKKSVKAQPSNVNKPILSVLKRDHRERDMRQEAIDMGAHGAREYFGSK